MHRATACRPVIVLEGPDGAGKSTLAERLQVLYQWPLVHTGGPNTSRQDVFDRIEKYEFMTRQRVIFDRIALISEPVYSVLQDRDSYLNDIEIHDLVEQMRPVVIYCHLADAERLVSRIRQTPKPHKPPEYLEKVLANVPVIASRYDRVIGLLNQDRVIHYDWERDSWSYLVETLRTKFQCVD